MLARSTTRCRSRCNSVNTFATGPRTTSTSSCRPTSPTRSRSRMASSPGSRGRSNTSTSRRRSTGTTTPAARRPEAARGLRPLSRRHPPRRSRRRPAPHRGRVEDRLRLRESRPNTAGAAATRPAQPGLLDSHRVALEVPMTLAHGRVTHPIQSPDYAGRFSIHERKTESSLSLMGRESGVLATKGTAVATLHRSRFCQVDRLLFPGLTIPSVPDCCAATRIAVQWSRLTWGAS